MTEVALTEQVNVDASPETVFAAATDWDRQREWMLGTTVRVLRGDGRSIGSELEAVTGIAGIGVADRCHLRVDRAAGAAVGPAGRGGVATGPPAIQLGSTVVP
jgi:hypothetical protein